MFRKTTMLAMKSTSEINKSTLFRKSSQNSKTTEYQKDYSAYEFRCPEKHNSGLIQLIESHD